MITATDIQFSYDVDPLAIAAFFVRADQLRDEPDVTPMKLQKLLYLAQANYLASTDRRLFDADVEAFEHGPVVYRIWQEFSGRQIISPDAHPEVLRMSVPPDVEEFLQNVWERYQDQSASALRRLTHSQSPWKDHYEPGVLHRRVPDESMRAYFAEVVPPDERILHPNVVIVDKSILDDDAEADAGLHTFLTT